VVTIFEGIKRHFHRQHIALDWVLYSNYDALVTAFVRGEVDLAWNGPLAYVKIRRMLTEPCSRQGKPETLELEETP
jgi:ABC-type phosphate/phosphonate transport system substrate-binding protein